MKILMQLNLVELDYNKKRSVFIISNTILSSYNHVKEENSASKLMMCPSIFKDRI